MGSSAQVTKELCKGLGPNRAGEDASTWREEADLLWKRCCQSVLQEDVVWKWGV